LINEGGGNTICDLSGNRNTGTFGAGAAAPTWLAGSTGSALLFDNASSQRCLAGKVPFITGAFTLVTNALLDESNTWVTYHTISLQQSTVDGQYQALGFYADTAGGGHVRAQSVAGTFSGVAINKNTWYQIAYVRYLATSRALFLNGANKTVSVLDDYLTPSVFNTLTIGYVGRLTPASYHSGKIQIAYVYNRALSDFEVAWLYCEPFAMFEQTPIYRMYSMPAGGLSIPVAMATYNRRRRSA
jgi:hypothetical protein